MDVLCVNTQTRAHDINNRGMNVYDLMETNMNKGVNEHFIYLCIFECFYRQHMWMMFETATTVYMVHLRPSPRLGRTQLVCMDHGP